MLPYLALLRAGFCLPSVLPRTRCALTAPFHHCLPPPMRARRDDDPSSSLAITGEIKRPTRRLPDGPSVSVFRPVAGPWTPVASLFGLAPCGVLPATRVTTGAVRSYRTFSPLPFDSARTRVRASLRAVYFLCHCPSGCPDRALPGALSCGVRTFLPPSLSPFRARATAWQASLSRPAPTKREARSRAVYFLCH
jgi:hypothetical protein